LHRLLIPDVLLSCSIGRQGLSDRGSIFDINDANCRANDQALSSSSPGAR
jgi:hypothetical protein